jgi:hypothetical protein
MSREPQLQQSGFFVTVWTRLRPAALSAVVDFGQYVFLWAGVLGAHLIKVLAAASGLEVEVIRAISFMERWTWIASFAAFFLRVLLRVSRGLVEAKGVV